MIVVDSNIIAYLYLPSELSLQAEELLAKEPEWVAPVLWRSELRNVLALYLRKELLTLEQAYAIQTEAEALLADGQYDVPSLDVLRLVESSECSAYDCEFVALAKRLNIKFVTADKKILVTTYPRHTNTTGRPANKSRSAANTFLPCLRRVEIVACKRA